MLKTFNVVEKYEEILPFLETKKNQSSFICELILKEMRDERIALNMQELNQQILESAMTLIQEEIRKGIQKGIREEIREEIRVEIRSEFRDLKRDMDELMKILEKESTTGTTPVSSATGRGISFRLEEGQPVKEEIHPLKSMGDPFKGD